MKKSTKVTAVQARTLYGLLPAGLALRTGDVTIQDHPAAFRVVFESG